MIKITPTIFLNEAEIKLSFIRAPGPGGQNVNKLATAAQLRFDVMQSPSLSEDMRLRLIALAGKKMTQQGELIIKASRYRTQERNKEDALNRLIALLKLAAVKPKKRKKTKPSLAAKEQRISKKKRHAKTKLLRSKKFKQDE